MTDSASPVHAIAEYFMILERIAAIAQGKGFGSATIRREVTRVHHALGRVPQLAVDIGANIGNYSAELRRRHANLEIHAFEPSFRNIEKLMERFSGDRSIVLAPCAVSNKAGKATLFSNEPGSGLASLTKRDLRHFDLSFDCAEAVDTIRFEDYWNTELRQRHIDIVKVDVEGHELAALHGFGHAMQAISALQFEFGGCNIDTRTYFRDFWYFFQDNGFQINRISPLGLVKIDRYNERCEFFSTTNYIAVNRYPASSSRADLRVSGCA